MRVALTNVARKLRVETTGAEAVLWRALRSRQIHGFKFKRQAPQGPYIADFLCVEAKLIVEIDGGQHAERCAEDRVRTSYFERSGFRVLRFWNNEVLQNRDGVLETIAGVLLQKSPLTQPSPQGERALGCDNDCKDIPSPLGEVAIDRNALADAEGTDEGGGNNVPSPLGERDRVRGSSGVRGPCA